MLINADLVKGKTVTSWPSIKVDLINAGGKWVDKEVILDTNLVTSRMPDDVPAFNKAMIELFAKAASGSSHLKTVSKVAEIENCLKTSYRVDDKSISSIVFKLTPLIKNFDYHVIIDDFIEKSENLKIQFSKDKISADLSKDDAVHQAPKWHEVLFESPYIRILWGKSIPGDHEPFHIHQWKSIMVITQAGKYEIQSTNGSIEKDLWPIGVYELPAETDPSAYTNIGESEFQALRFEIKD